MRLLSILLVVGALSVGASACGSNSSSHGPAQPAAHRTDKQAAKLAREKKAAERARRALRRERARARRARERERQAREAERAQAARKARAKKKRAGGGGTSPASNCDPNYKGACLDPNARDYDCEGGSGDGPKYTGPVTVVGDDHYDLDRDGDGSACE